MEQNHCDAVLSATKVVHSVGLGRAASFRAVSFNTASFRAAGTRFWSSVVLLRCSHTRPSTASSIMMIIFWQTSDSWGVNWSDLLNKVIIILRSIACVLALGSNNQTHKNIIWDTSLLLCDIVCLFVVRCVCVFWMCNIRVIWSHQWSASEASSTSSAPSTSTVILTGLFQLCVASPCSNSFSFASALGRLFLCTHTIASSWAFLTLTESSNPYLHADAPFQTPGSLQGLLCMVD